MNPQAMLAAILAMLKKDPTRALAMLRRLLDLLELFPELLPLAANALPPGAFRDLLTKEPAEVIACVGEVVDVLAKHPKVFAALVAQYQPPTGYHPEALVRLLGKKMP